MSKEVRSIAYGDQEIPFVLDRRARKTLAINVLPDGGLEVVAPEQTTYEKIEEVLLRRMPWIQRQKADFGRLEQPWTARSYLSGETHWYRGRQYRLKVELGLAQGVKLSRGRLLVSTHTPGRPERTKELVDSWRRQRAKVVFAERLEAVLPLFEDQQAVRPTSTIIRQLSKRWGSMTRDGRLILNLDLLNASTPAIDYVLIHELCHRVEHHHGRAFWELLERKLPDWRVRKDMLETTVRSST
ncbi:M48 family metallopeptidase [Roseovarius sp.]|uniref:M48 family metallopeptidase n=1 Tax=Roseovarius sp. TaxID=1486281 RepID=UPI003A983C58